MSMSDHQLIRPLAPHEFTARIRALLLTIAIFIVAMSIGDDNFRAHTMETGMRIVRAVSVAVDTQTVHFQSALAQLSLIQ